MVTHENVKSIFKDNALVIVRCYAISILKKDFLISQDNKDYEKCMKRLAEEIDIEYDKFDLLIDTMCGDPLDIFRA